MHLSFAGDRKLSGAVDIHEGREAMQRGFERLEEWANENLMEVNKAKGWNASRMKKVGES